MMAPLDILTAVPFAKPRKAKASPKKKTPAPPKRKKQ